MCAEGGGRAWDTHTPPWTEFLTHACENITFPQLLLRAVIIYEFMERVFIFVEPLFCT